MIQHQPLMAEYHERFKDDPDYVMEGLYLEFTEEVWTYMETYGITEQELMRRMSLSEDEINQLFSDSASLSLKTMAKILIALKADLNFHAVPRWGGLALCIAPHAAIL